MNFLKPLFFSVFITVLSLSNSTAQCTSPVNLQESYTNNTTTFSWNNISGSTSYVFQAKRSIDSWAQASIIDTITINSYSLTNITPSLSIDWRVQSICTNGVSSFTSKSYMIPCPSPTNMYTTNVTMTSAVLNWTPSVGYNAYISGHTLAYKKINSNTWIPLGNTTDSSIAISNLQANTTYQWSVTQTCPNSNGTTLVSTFTTGGCLSSGINTNEWISKFQFGNINRTSTAEINGYSFTQTTATFVAGSRRNKGEITADHSGNFNQQVFKIYIDYNDNGIFEPGESIYGPAAIKNTRANKFSINIPSNVPSGIHNMRVIMARKGTNINGCLSGFNGETEDYIISIAAGSSNKQSLAIEEKKSIHNAISIYPNPATTMLRVLVNNSVSKITVYNITGSKVAHYEHPTTNFEINVLEWPTGQYIIGIVYKDGTKENIRFIKQ